MTQQCWECWHSPPFAVLPIGCVDELAVPHCQGLLDGQGQGHGHLPALLFALLLLLLLPLPLPLLPLKPVPATVYPSSDTSSLSATTAIQAYNSSSSSSIHTTPLGVLVQYPRGRDALSWTTRLGAPQRTTRGLSYHSCSNSACICRFHDRKSFVNACN